ncbi:MAG: hypothetical protein GX552_09405 [Chloroflexi bacterium]|jgi:hypothetical protein|nr:hypothetical protein [Chloroflexota bacterium]
MVRKWYISLLLSLALLITIVGAVSADSTNVIKNGSFEEGFIWGVGQHWNTFSNGGSASYGYHDDTWDPVVYDGEYSQLLEVHTKAVTGSQLDRYMGIYQVVDVVPNQPYLFSMYGLIRSTEGTEKDSEWNYRVQVGFDYSGGTDFNAVTNWVEVPWREWPRLQPGKIESFSQSVTPTSNKLTVFIRAWKKFPTIGQEGNINIDAVSLLGPSPAAAPATPAPAATPTPTLPATGVGMGLPVLGLGLGAAALGLTRRRLRNRR